jgi:iron complex outermembrane recepter protein
MKSMIETGRVGFQAGIPAAVAIALAYVGPAHADAADADNSDQLQTVTVTAEKVSSSLQKVPLSITALSGDALDSRNIQSVKDLDSVVPGVMVAVAPASPLVVTIRGAGN